MSLMDTIYPGSTRQLAGDHGAKLKLSARLPAAVADIGHGHCFLPGLVPGSSAVNLAPNLNYLPGAGGDYRY